MGLSEQHPPEGGAGAKAPGESVPGMFRAQQGRQMSRGHRSPFVVGPCGSLKGFALTLPEMGSLEESGRGAA